MVIKMVDKEVKKEEQVEKPVAAESDNVEPKQQAQAMEEPKIMQVPGDLIVRVAYVCENEGCGQSWQAATRSCPLHCPFCNGPIAIAQFLYQTDYTAEQKAAIMRAREAAAQAAAAQAEAARAAAQAQAQATAGKPAYRPINRPAPK
jgi:nucleoid-associated protein YgaU